MALPEVCVTRGGSCSAKLQSDGGADVGGKDNEVKPQYPAGDDWEESKIQSDNGESKLRSDKGGGFGDVGMNAKPQAAEGGEDEGDDKGANPEPFIGDMGAITQNDDGREDEKEGRPQCDEDGRHGTHEKPQP